MVPHCPLSVPHCFVSLITHGPFIYLPEFCEALCGCSCYKVLDPYFTLNQKLDHLCSRYIVPFATRVKRNTVRNGIADSLVQIAKGMN